MSACITCGREAGPLSDELRRAKEKFGMPLTPPKRCPRCVWESLLEFAASEDEDEVATESNTDTNKEK